MVKRSKKETDKPQLFFDNTAKKSKLKIPNGIATCMNSMGHGTLSKTFGILEKICKKEINILNCPTHLYTFFVAFSWAMDLDRTKFSCTLSRVMYSRKTTTKSINSTQATTMGIIAKAKELPPEHSTHDPPIMT